MIDVFIADIFSLYIFFLGGGNNTTATYPLKTFGLGSFNPKKQKTRSLKCLLVTPCFYCLERKSHPHVADVLRRGLELFDLLFLFPINAEGVRFSFF